MEAALGAALALLRQIEQARERVLARINATRLLAMATRWV
jgi:hypothetical protein